MHLHKVIKFYLFNFSELLLFTYSWSFMILTPVAETSARFEPKPGFIQKTTREGEEKISLSGFQGLRDFHLLGFSNRSPDIIRFWLNIRYHLRKNWLTVCLSSLSLSSTFSLFGPGKFFNLAPKPKPESKTNAQILVTYPIHLSRILFS